MGLLAYILTLPGNNDACGHQPRGTYLFFLLPPSYLFLPLFIPSSFLYIIFFLLLPHLIPFFYVCVYLSPFSIPSSSSFLYVCPPSLYPFYLSPFFIPSSSSFFYVCMYIFIFYLIFYFWTDLGNVCHYNKYMEKFLTIQSSIFLQTNSKKHIFFIFFIFTPPHFYMSVCIFYFFTLFFIFGPIWGTFVIITNI